MPLTEDKNVAEMVAKNQPDLSNIFKEPSYDELKEALENWLNPEESAETETVSETVTEEKNNDQTPVNTVDDVSSAFDTLFND